MSSPASSAEPTGGEMLPFGDAMSDVPAPVPNVRVRSNVICTRLSDPDVPAPLWDFSTEGLLPRLFFWELLELSRRMPLLIPRHLCHAEAITPRQLAERDAFMRAGLTAGSLWPPGMPRMAPMPPREGVVPFFAEPAGRGEEVALRPDVTEARQAPSTTEAREAEADVDARPGQDGGLEVSPGPVIEESPDSPTVGGAEDALDAQRISVPPPVPPPTDSGLAQPPEEAAELDEQQRQVVEAPLAARLIVLAPPGTGKTHTLIERIRHVIHSCEVDAAHTVVALSFTRSAVAEIVSRVARAVQEGHADNLRFITVRTFDSFVTQLLLRDLRPEQLPSGGYEKRISFFTSRLQANALPEAAKVVDGIRCLLVDEVQDLVGVRAQLVLALIRRVAARNGGVVLLGDPAQAIYDWQHESDGGMLSSRFMAEARKALGAQAQQVVLRTDRRSTCQEVRGFVQRARQAMGEDGSTPDGAMLGRLLRELGSPAGLDAPGAAQASGTVAVLTRMNIQAFQFARWCRDRGIACNVLRGASGHYPPGWIARLVSGFKGDRMSRGEAANRWALDVGDRPGRAFEDAYGLLRRAGVAAESYIDLRALSRRVMENAPELSARQASNGSLVVSTIHRSKGLQFDQVFLLEPNSWEGKEGEIRTVYVAATRARSRICVLRNEPQLGRCYWPRKGLERLEHFHEFDKSSLENRFLLDGIGELDVDSLLEPLEDLSLEEPGRVVAERQDALWRGLDGSQGRLSVLTYQGGPMLMLPGAAGNGGPVPICRVSDTLEADLDLLARKCRLRVMGLTCVPAIDLATVAFPPDDEEAGEVLGKARLAIVPVLQGWGTVACS